MILIETFQTLSADFSQTLILDEVLVELRLVWNNRSEYWMLNSYKELDEDNTRYGVKLTKEYPLLFPLKAGLKLPGDFMIIKTDESIINTINYDNLNNGWDFYYLTSTEVSAWENINGI